MHKFYFSLCVAAGNDTQFAEFTSVIGLENLAASNGRFSTNSLRVEHRKELIEILNDCLSKKTNAEWDKVFRAARVRFPYGPVNKLSEVFSDPQAMISHATLVICNFLLQMNVICGLCKYHFKRRNVEKI